MPEQDTIYCANDPCETEATHRTPNNTPLCTCCAEAYTWGQATPDGAVTPIEEAEAEEDA